jgi:lipopolysaccharide export system permease protein
MIFFMQITTQVLPRVLYKGVSFEIIAELLLVSMASIISLALPMTLLISSLMVFGKLSSDNEYTAMKAVGMSLFDMLPPIISLSAIIGVLLLFFNCNILPNANHHAAQLMSDVMRKKPAALIDPGVLIKDFPGYAIKVDSVTAGTGRLYGITIFTTQNNQIPIVSVADSGTLYLTKDEKYLELTMFSGQTISENIGNGNNNEADFFRIDFAKQTFFVENIKSDFTRSNLEEKGEREIKNDSLIHIINNLKSNISNEKKRYNEWISEISNNMNNSIADSSAILYMDDFSQWYSTINSLLSPRSVSDALKSEINFVNTIMRNIKENKNSINGYSVEVHKKYSLAIGAIIFAVLGIPLGIIAKNGSAAISVSYSLIFFIFYWAFLIGGEYSAKKGNILPVAAMWGGNVVLTLVAVWLLRKVSGYESGFRFSDVIKVILIPFRKLLNNMHDIKILRIIKTVFGHILDLPEKMLNLFLPIIPAYIIGRFFSYFLVTTAGLSVLTVIIDFVGNITVFTDAKFNELAVYYLYFIASFMSMILPISMLLSVMLSMGSFSKTNELTAIKSSGISVVRTTFPLIFVGLFFSVGIFFFNESVLASANEKLELYRDTFSARRNGRPIPTEVTESRRNFYYFSNENTAYFFKRINTSPAKHETVVKYSFENYRIKSITTANIVDYDPENNLWIMPDGKEKILQSDGSIIVNELSQVILTDLTQKPVDMLKQIRKVEQMSYSELKKRIENAKLRGEKTQKYLADSNFKFSLPLMNVVVVLVGIAATVRSTKRGGAVHFGAGLVFVFIYWVIAQFLITLGRNESVNPIIAAWSATFIFLVLGFFLYTKASK